MAPEVAQLHLGRVDDLADTILKNVVDVILVAMPIQSCYPQMQRAITIAESVGIKVIYMGDLYSSVSKSGPKYDKSMFTELAPEQSNYVMQHVAKRAADILFAAGNLILFSPIMLAIAIGIKLTSDGPVLFSQQRYGYRRRLFTMYKFRTMVTNAEELLATLEHANEADGPIFKIKDDPRVTRFGKFLRTTSLDELPQLWNVLIGEMSMVGPRPMSVRDVTRFSDVTLLKRFSVKAGITGLWQVSGRSSVGFDEWIAMDFRYIESWSLLMDLKIMFQTVGAVLKRSGAM
jgi:exopolysaccharide biosynthesis polyprenyl glycosylphosphotransferase